MFKSIFQGDDDFLPSPKKKSTPILEDHKISKCLKNVSHRFSMHINTDKHQYKPGETVHIRGILLNEFTHQPAFKRFQGESFNFRILGPSGAILLGGDDVAAPSHMKSVTAVDWKIPDGQAGGTYKIQIGKQFYDKDEYKKDEEESQEEETEGDGEEEEYIFAPGSASMLSIEDNVIKKIGRKLSWNAMVKYPIKNQISQSFRFQVHHHNTSDLSGIFVGVVGAKTKKSDIWKAVGLNVVGKQPLHGNTYEYEVSESRNTFLIRENGKVIHEGYNNKLSQFQRPLSFGVFLHYPDNEVTVLSPSGLGGFFPVATRTFDVLNYTPPKFKMNLEFPRKGYSSGELVRAELKIERSEGGAPPKCDIVATARVDGAEVFRKSYVSTTGQQMIEFELPPEIKFGDGKLNCIVTEGVTENISKTIPILLRKLDCALYPEGGDLVYGCGCGCYFEAATLYGDPADFSGFVIETDVEDPSQVAPIVEVRTIHEGRGHFEMTPRRGKKYHIKVLTPFGISVPIELPPIKDVGLSIRLPIKSSVPFGTMIDVIVSASRDVETKIGLYKKDKCVYMSPILSLSSMVKLDPKDVDGVLRITSYFTNSGFGVTGLEYPIAERLVMVKPRGVLDFEIESPKLVYSPGEKCKVKIKSRYLGKPVPSIMCCTVTDDTIIQMQEKRKRPPRLCEMVYFENEVKTLKDCTAYLMSREEGNIVSPEICCDLLLGTQGWRRYVYRELLEKKLDGMNDKSELFFRMLNLPNPEYFERKEMLEKKIEGSVILIEDKLKKKNTKWSRTKITKDEKEGKMIVFDDLLEEEEEEEDSSKKKSSFKKIKKKEKVDVLIPMGKRVKKEMEKKKKKKKQETLKINKISLSRPSKKLKKRKPMKRMDRRKKEYSDSDSDYCSSCSTDSSTTTDSDDEQPIIEIKTIAYAIEYAHQTRPGKKPEVRDDFTETVFFSPFRETIYNNKTNTYETDIQFDLSDSISSFIVRVDAFSFDGAIGSSDTFQLRVQKPFYLTPKLPLEVSMADEVRIPLGIVNNLPLQSKCKVEWDTKNTQFNFQKLFWSGKLNANERKVEYFNMKVNSTFVEEEKQVVTVSGELVDFRMKDVVKKEISIKPYGFLTCQPFSGTIQMKEEKVFEFAISTDTYVPFSLETVGFVMPSSLGNLLSATQGLIREPYGCFEQVSSTMYPMIMAKLFLQSQNQENLLTKDKNNKIDNFLSKGLNKLMSYEIKGGGFDWYGRAPANESLSAMGLVQFIQLSKCFSIDPNVVDRTRKWLLNRRSGNSFKRGEGRYAYGHAKKFTTNSYIVWSLSRSGCEFKDVEKIIRHLHENAVTMQFTNGVNDNYTTSLLSMSYYNMEKYDEAKQLAKLLVPEQDGKDGCFRNCLDTMTRSGGRNRILECTALATLALMNFKDEEPGFANTIAKSIEFIVKNNTAGSYGSTQATVLCLEAVIRYFGSGSDEVGIVTLEVNGVLSSSLHIPKRCQDKVEFGDFRKLVKTNGEKNRLVMRSRYGRSLPFSMALWYKISVPPKEQDELPFLFGTKIRSTRMKEGDSTEIEVLLESKLSEEELPMIVAIVAIPSGCSVRMEKLKELQKQEKFAYFELFGARNVVFYWRGMAPSQKIEFSFDVSASIPGKYISDASRAYLYYDNDVKFYVKGLEVEIDTNN